MIDIEKRLAELEERLCYIRDIFGYEENANTRLLEGKIIEFKSREKNIPTLDGDRLLSQLEGVFDLVEKKLEESLIPMNKVRIVRHPQRITLKDILENVYDNYTEIGGKDEYSIDPGMLIARAYITRRRKNKVYNQAVMVIGQEKGHGQEFRNGGSIKPWGNANALMYMKVAETEDIPIHTYVFTPGAYPIEDYPGAAQQIARNLYEMAGLKVPIVSVFSEGGSGGAEAISLSDMRLMLSHGYYSVISPEGAAAIESGIRQGQRAPAGLIEECAANLCITAQDNLRLGFVDRIIEEPILGARPHHYDFFKQLRHEVISATDEVVLSVKGLKVFSKSVVKKRQSLAATASEDFYVHWKLDESCKEKLLWRRYVKFRHMAQNAFINRQKITKRMLSRMQNAAWIFFSYLRHDILGKTFDRVSRTTEEIKSELLVALDKINPLRSKNANKETPKLPKAKQEELTKLSHEYKGTFLTEAGWTYVSPQAKEDRAVTCPNSLVNGCLDQWAPDLFGDFAGVCAYCGHHFPMEYQWFLYNVFDEGTIKEFGAPIESMNPLHYPGFDEKLAAAKKKTGRKCACLTFEAKIKGYEVAVAVLTAGFRGGTVGAAEGEKFIQAAARARKKHLPLLAYVHGTAGIRIQEGVGGVIQMPRCTLSIRRYIESGGLYLVIYDTNSYAGPVASFLGCSPYQFSIRSANIGFAGPGVIKETTGIDIPPDYHKAYNALARGHIQGIWDRRELRKNIHQAFLTIGGGNLYYR